MSKTEKPSSPDSLTKTSEAASVELSESELSKVSGGETVKINNITFGVQKDKMQSANKNADAVKALL
jgi:bacteriocin-like protein